MSGMGMVFCVVEMDGNTILEVEGVGLDVVDGVIYSEDGTKWELQLLALRIVPKVVVGKS